MGVRVRDLVIGVVVCCVEMINEHALRAGWARVLRIAVLGAVICLPTVCMHNLEGSIHLLFVAGSGTRWPDSSGHLPNGVESLTGTCRARE